MNLVGMPKIDFVGPDGCKRSFLNLLNRQRAIWFNQKRQRHIKKVLLLGLIEHHRRSCHRRFPIVGRMTGGQGVYYQEDKEPMVRKKGGNKKADTQRY